jgi:phenylacetate-CoA ligase
MLSNRDYASLIRSAVSGIAWPAIPGPAASAMLALEYQLERTQWLAPERLQALQFRQLDALVRHAYETAPYYRERWTGIYDPSTTLTPEAFGSLPVLRRSELQSHFEAIRSRNVPAAHGGITEARTSGSTGMPVRVLKTELVELWWRVMALRDHRWHRRDLTLKLAGIRHKAERDETDGWGAATDALLMSGPSATLPISLDVDSQLDWLEQQQPDYLMTYPSNVAELARCSLERGIRLPRLREVRTFGEGLGPEVVPLCREAWGVPVTDVYSANEVGYIALQCPEGDGYHVQSESLRVEILDDAGRECRPGQVGRVVITDLHNFAQPLVRYELGDYAEAGPPCACGRGLGFLRRIHGRVRNMLVLANGERHWPSFGQRGFAEIAPVLQHKFVQRDYSTIEAHLVTGRPLTASEEEALSRHVLSRLPGRFTLKLVYCREIPRSTSGKFEDFESDVARAMGAQRDR